MKKTMEKVSILGLSLMLTTAFSISSALPAMFDFYKDRPASQVELLISLPSVGIIVMLLVNGLVERFLSERQMIGTGLLVLSSCAFVPLFTQAYPLIFLSRLLFGLGVGLINAKAISIISQRYQGRERTQMLGYRGSAEVVGTALLTLLVGQLLHLGWTKTFLVYSFALVILVFYLLFVPEQAPSRPSDGEGQRKPLSPVQWRFSLLLSLVAAVIVCTNVAINLRIPSLIVHSGMGTAQLASLMLSAMQLVGIVAGLTFSALTGIFKAHLVTVASLTFGLGQILIGFSPSIWCLALSTLLAGFAYSTALTAIFHLISEGIPGHLLNQVTSIIILGCSIGATLSPFLLSLLDGLVPSTSWLFSCLGFLMILAGGLPLIFLSGKERAHAAG